MYLIKLLFLSIPIFLIVDLNLYPLQKFITVIVHYLLNLFGVENMIFNSLNSNMLIVPAFYLTQTNTTVLIDPACSGVRSFYFLFALLFSLKWEPKKQFKYLIIGGLILLLVNLLRIFLTSLIVVMYNIPYLFENIIWTSSLNITVLIIFYYYLKH